MGRECYYSGSMPPDVRPPIGPLPANVGAPRPPQAVRWGKTLWILITLTIAFGAFFNAWDARPTGTVTLLVRDLDGTRRVGTFSLREKAFSERTDVDASEITTISARIFALSDASVVTLDTPGVVRRGGGQDGMSVLVASPVSPFLNTPLSVWGDGARVAWVNPADRSVQVFVRSERGAYLPGYLNRDFRANSLGFTDDGSTLVLGKIAGDTTEIHSIKLSNGRMQHITTVPGFASVVPTP